MAKHILILGAGYGGVLASQEIRRLLTADAAEITVVNRQPFHQIVTELHQPAAGSAPEHHVRIPLSKLFARKRIEVVIGEVAAIHLDRHAVELAGGTEINYDYLVVGLGSETEYFGIPGLKEYSFTLKSIDDARRIREHVRQCIETYSKTKDESYLTFAVGGAGLTGIELIGELADTLPTYCREHGVDPARIKLLSIEAMPSILPGFSQSLVERARTSLQNRGVEFLTGVPLVKLEPGAAHLKDGRVIPTQTMIWTGGVRGNGVVAASGLAVEPRGRAQVNTHLQSVNHPEVFVVGDSAIVIGPEGRPYPPTAQIAMQMGVHVGQQIHTLMKGGKLEDFHPHLAGTLASLGRKDAIGLVGSRKIEVKGKPASWLKEGSQLRYLTTIGALFARS